MDYNIYQGLGRDKYSGFVRPLTYLPNAQEWVDRVLCLEAETAQYQADEVLGGLSGISNAQAQALANRTFFLRDNLVKLSEIVIAMQEALGPLITTIKALIISHIEPSDWVHQAWLGFENDEAYQAWRAQWTSAIPTFEVYYLNGTHVRFPILEVTCEDGKTYFLRTDGTEHRVPAVEEYLDPEAINMEDDEE